MASQIDTKEDSYQSGYRREFFAVAALNNADPTNVIFINVFDVKTLQLVNKKNLPIMCKIGGTPAK